MKKLIPIIIALLVIGYFFKTISDKKDQVTKIQVVNGSDTTIQVYLTLGGGAGWVQDVYGVFNIADSGLQGRFTLNPGDTVLYSPTMPIQGNISFGYPPLNCPVGITLYEFCLNNYGTVRAAQETVEISCVAGVSSLGRFTLSGGGQWNASPLYPNVTTFKNDTLGANTGLVGVYPYGCTNCTNTAGKPSCVTNPEKADSANICNVQRRANISGGIITIEFLKLINQ